MYTSLCRLKVGQSAEVISVEAKGAILRRLLDIGIVEGTKIKCILSSPLGDPIAYLIRGAVIALRNEDSEKISVRIVSSAQEVAKNGTYDTVGG